MFGNVEAMPGMLTVLVHFVRRSGKDSNILTFPSQFSWMFLVSCVFVGFCCFSGWVGLRLFKFLACVAFFCGGRQLLVAFSALASRIFIEFMRLFSA